MKERQLMGADHPQTLTAGFDRLLRVWSDPADWRHHWSRLGLALCALKARGDLAPAEAVRRDLVALLGADHDRAAEADALIRELCEGDEV